MMLKQKEMTTASDSHSTLIAKQSKTSMNTAVIQTMKSKTLSDNIKRVRIVNQTLKNKKSVLTEYLFLPDTKTLRDVLTDSVLQQEVLEP